MSSGSFPISVILDTGPLLATANRHDPLNRAMTRLLGELAAEILVPDSVVVEAEYMMRAHVSPRTAATFLEDLATGVFRRVCLDDELFARAVRFNVSYADLRLGIVDASVMALAEREHAAILTLDFRDFRATRPAKGGHWRLVLDEKDLERLRS